MNLLRNDGARGVPTATEAADAKREAENAVAYLRLYFQMSSDEPNWIEDVTAKLSALGIQHSEALGLAKVIAGQTPMSYTIADAKAHLVVRTIVNFVRASSPVPALASGSPRTSPLSLALTIEENPTMNTADRHVLLSDDERTALGLSPSPEVSLDGLVRGFERQGMTFDDAQDRAILLWRKLQARAYEPPVIATQPKGSSFHLPVDPHGRMLDVTTFTMKLMNERGLDFDEAQNEVVREMRLQNLSTALPTEPTPHERFQEQILCYQRAGYALDDAQDLAAKVMRADRAGYAGPPDSQYATAVEALTRLLESRPNDQTAAVLAAFATDQGLAWSSATEWADRIMRQLNIRDHASAERCAADAVRTLFDRIKAEAIANGALR